MVNLHKEELPFLIFNPASGVTKHYPRRTTGTLRIHVQLSDDGFINIVLANVIYKRGVQTVLSPA